MGQMQNPVELLKNFPRPIKKGQTSLKYDTLKRIVSNYELVYQCHSQFEDNETLIDKIRTWENE